ncbi:23S rRNA (uracil(1939)-C(5))-methyltransferase RlmD [Cohnella soli]|uniref:23S rRNA (Uracil(1939)-C(5))-methyltransferase RlmD n=1 Tax=Cohnella soli TaxID=425005 RepID=A0ABW0I071_9BACL
MSHSRKSGGNSGSLGGAGRGPSGRGGSGKSAGRRGDLSEHGNSGKSAGRNGGRANSAGREQRNGVRDHGAGRGRSTAPAGVPVAVGESVSCEIIGLTHDGEGVGRVAGYTLFVRGALPGERVQADVVSVGKSFGRARMTKLLAAGLGASLGASEGDATGVEEDRTVGAIRVEPPCPIYDTCGGCQLQHMDYAAQLRWKRQHVIDNLERIGKLTVVGGRSASVGESGAAGESAGDMVSGEGAAASNRPGVIVHPTIGMDEPWRYRNKAQVPIGVIADRLVGGFYELGSNDIVDMDACLIQQEQNEESVRAVKEAARLLKLSAYDRTTGRGLLRHVVVRHSRSTGHRMVVLVTNGRDIPHAQELVSLVREQVPGVVSICQNVNTVSTPVVFGEETRVLWGEEYIYDEIDGIQFAISPRSFFQVNPEQTVRLYGKAVEYAALTGNETVVDAYCGAGTISLFLARHAARVYGVEIVPEAIEDARRNASLNGIANAEFDVGAAEVIMPQWQREGIAPDVIVVDPPRKGCDPRLLETMLELKPERIVYVSCNPSTLARDLRLLENGGYRTVEVQPVDMFPHTGHVECVIGIQRIDT